MANAALNLKKGQAVLVSLRGGTAGHEVEQPGTITEVAGKGAFVKLDKGGNQNFFYLSKIRPVLAPAEAVAAPGSFAKLGEVARVIPPKHLDPKPPQPLRPAGGSIGDLLLAERNERGLTQDAFARAVGLSQVRLSEFERGIARPRDDDLIAIAETFDIDIALLTDATERFSLRKGEPTKPDVLPLPTAAVPEPPASPTPTPCAPRALGADFEDFMERLMDVVPLPIDREKRRRWVAIARSLFELSEPTAQSHSYDGP